MVPVVVALGWGAWWWVGAEAQERAITGWLDGRAAEGWQAEYAKVEVGGFPARFERRVEDLILTDPRHGWSVRAPWIASESATFGPNRFTVSVAPEMTVAVPGETIAATTTANRFELGVEPLPSMPLDDVAVLLDDLRLEAGEWQASADSLTARVAERAADAAPENTYDVTLDAANVELPETLLRSLRIGSMPAVERVELDGHATLDHALDRDFVEEAELSARTVVIRKAALRWGDMALDARGRLDADADGFAEGTVDVALTNWRRMIRMAQQSGAIGADLAAGLETALGLASMFSSRDGALEVPLRFEGRRLYVGPVSVGEAPRISFPPRVRGEG